MSAKRKSAIRTIRRRKEWPAGALFMTRDRHGRTVFWSREPVCVDGHWVAPDRIGTTIWWESDSKPSLRRIAGKVRG